MAIEKEGKDLRANIIITKPIVYIDLDGVLADFDTRHDEILKRGVSKNDAFNHPDAFRDLTLMPGAKKAFHELEKNYEVYILSTPSWENLTSWKEKRIWVEKYLGITAKKKLILSHNKGLLKGDYLIDDRIANGVSDFQGEHIHFGSAQFPDWEAVLDYLNITRLWDDDIKFLKQLLPPWIANSTLKPGSDCMSYLTLSYEGDKKIHDRVHKILNKLKNL